MLVQGYNSSSILGAGPWVHCRHPDSFSSSKENLFLADVYRWIWSNFDVNKSDVEWLTTEEFPKICQKVVHLGQSVQVECLVNQEARLMVRKLHLQIGLVRQSLHIRLLSEIVVGRVDVRNDISRSGFRECRWPKPLDPRTHVINTDGSLKGDRAAISWIFRTAQGRSFAACSAPCQKMPICVIEVWAIREAFFHAVGNIKFVVAQADATIAISMINTIAASFSDLISTCRDNGRNYLEASKKQNIRCKSPRDDHKLEEYVRSVIINHSKWTGELDSSSSDFLMKALVDVIYYLESFQQWGCKYLMREANTAADFLTKLAREEAVFLNKSEEYPEKLLRIVNEDPHDDMWYKRMKPTPREDNFNESTGWRLL